MDVRRVLLTVAFVAVAVAASPTAGAIPGYVSCPPGDTHRLDVRGVGCDDASTVVGAYRWEGDKFQTISEFTCYSAQYDVYPIVLTCVGGESEIVVSEL